MRIILTDEVNGLGTAGDVVEVKDGYARNFLLPRRKAILATRGAEKQVATIRRARDAREIRDLGHATEIKARLQKLSVSLPARAGEGGRLYGSVTAADVVDAVRAAGGPALDRRRVELSAPIRSVGQHAVTVRLHPEVSTTITISVTAS